MTTCKLRSVPAVTLIYGPSGSGKTTDMGYSFPNALFLATRGSLQSIRSTCGFSPAQMEVKTIEDATKAVANLKKSGAKFDAVVIDDFSFLAERTFSQIGGRFKGNNFAKWNKLDEVTLEFRDVTRHHNCHVIINCWEQPPKTTKDGRFRKGGPQLSGKLVEQVPTLCDQVFRVGHEPSRALWPSSYYCQRNHPRWLMKDRFGLAYHLHPAPMNLAEILRASGYELSRLAACNGQEKFVEQLTQSFLAGNFTDPQRDGWDSEKINQLFSALVGKGQDRNHVQWSIRDAMDRTIIRRAIQHKNSRLFA